MASSVPAPWPIPPDELVARRARALVQHQRIMDEAAAVARLTAQARRRLAAVPVFGTGDAPNLEFRSRVHWEQAG